MKRWLKFNAVGFGGILLQLAALALLTGALRMNYALATALAVEAAIIHNYFWHQHYTWADRSKTRASFLKCNLTTGTFSIAGNVAMMGLLVGKLHFHYLLGNGLSIAACSIANFLVSDRFVFEDKPILREHIAPGETSRLRPTEEARASTFPVRRNPPARRHFG
jgi:putative flippase GtrA